MNRSRSHSLSSPMAFLARSFLIAGLVAVAGCQHDSPDVGGRPAPTASPGKPRIALVMKSLANEFFATMAEGARRYEREHAGTFELIVNGIKDERDLSRQVGLVDEMIAQGASAIVIAPADSKALVSACKRARDAGIIIVNIDNKLDDRVMADQGLKIPFVGPDNRAGARKVGEYLAKRLKPGDLVVVLTTGDCNKPGNEKRPGQERHRRAQ